MGLMSPSRLGLSINYVIAMANGHTNRGVYELDITKRTFRSIVS